MNSEMLLYQDGDGVIKVDVRLEDETVWLTQAQMCELFQKSQATISEHIKMCLKRENWMLCHLFGISEQFKKKAHEK